MTTVVEAPLKIFNKGADTISGVAKGGFNMVGGVLKSPLMLVGGAVLGIGVVIYMTSRDKKN